MTPADASGRGVERRFRREAERWDAIYREAGSPLWRLWDRLARRNVRERFARTFAALPDLRGKTVLDLGCGSGRYLAEALERGAARVVGVDVAPEMLAIARALAAARGAGERAVLVCEDARRVELAERFDLVIANGLFDYVAPAAPLLARAAGWCRDTLVASFPDRRALRALPRRLYWRRRGIRVHLFERAEVAALAAGAGLSRVTIERLGPIYLLIARATDPSSRSR